MREIKVEEIADLLELDGLSHKRRIEKARRYLRRLGIARQHAPRGHVFTTMRDLRAKANHLWAELVATVRNRG